MALMIAFHVAYFLTFFASLSLAWGPWALPAVLAGVYFADFGSGLTHIVLDADDFLTPEQRDACRRGLPGESVGLSGFKLVVYDFMGHHLRPADILASPFYSPGVAGHALKLLAVPASIGWVAAYLLGWHEVCLFWMTAFTVGVHAQLIHQAAHDPNRGRFVRALQAMRLMLRTRPHGVHHTPPHDVNFCIVTGWANPLLNALVRTSRSLLKAL